MICEDYRENFRSSHTFLMIVNIARKLEDQYRRTLAYVYLEDGRFVNAELVKNG